MSPPPTSSTSSDLVAGAGAAVIARAVARAGGARPAGAALGLLVLLSAPLQPAAAQEVAGGSAVEAGADAAEGAEGREPTAEQALQREAEALADLVDSALARGFLAAAAELPEVSPRRLWRHRESRAWLSDAAWEALPDDERAAHEPVEAGASTFYATKYGSPLAYARALDLLGRAGLDSLQGRRVLDYGHGTIGHLRLLALTGADCVGLDVDPFLTALYAAPGDQGPLVVDGRPRGAVTLLQGRWPGERAIAEAAGGGFAVVMSKNTLKRGYVHPEREARPEHLLQMGVDDASYVRAVADALLPGGYFLIYNLCPPPAAEDEPYVPWADGRCPFPRTLLEEHGLAVLAYDAVDDEAARGLGERLGWGSADDLQRQLFAWYTLARKHGELPPATRR